MTGLNKTARIAGLLYLLFVICGIFYLRYVPSRLIAPGNAALTADNISGHLTLFRLGIVVEIVADVIFLLLALAFYRILCQVNLVHALIMMIFVAFSIVISLISLQSKYAVMILVSQNGHLKFDNTEAAISLYLNLYRTGIIIGQIFWGLWLFPLGYLVFKSGFLPKLLGVLLMVGCFGYLVNFAGTFFFPHYDESSISNYITLPASLGELSICLWLLIMGAKKQPEIQEIYPPQPG